MKYQRYSDESLSDLNMGYVRSLYQMRSRAVDPTARLGDHLFLSPDDQLMYDMLYGKAQRRGLEIGRRRRYNMTHAEKMKLAWKTYWKFKRTRFNWDDGNWKRRGISAPAYYKWQKGQFKSKFHKRPLLVGHKYSGRGFRAWPIYKEYPYV